MVSTYSTNLRVELIADGDQDGTWGQTTNRNLGTLLEQAISGVQSITHDDSAAYTLTTQDGQTDEARNMVVVMVGALSANRQVIVPSVDKFYVVVNSTSGGFSLEFKTAAGTGVTVGNGDTATVYCDATNVELVSRATPSASETAYTPTGSIVATNVQAAIDELDAEKLALGGGTMSGELVLADNLLTRAQIKDFSVTTDAGGNTGASITFDLQDGNYHTATVSESTTLSFANPPSAGNTGVLYLELTNGGAFAVTFPASVSWDRGDVPDLQTSGVDVLGFLTNDAGATWRGFIVWAQS